MKHFLEQFERVYFRHANLIPRLLLGIIVAFWVRDLVLANSYALPSGWVGLTPILLAGLFIAGELIGVAGTLLLLGLMTYNTWGMLGVVLGIVLVLLLCFMFVIFRLVFAPVLQRQFAIRGHGRATLLLLSPFLVSANLGFVVPLAAGLNWGGAGVVTAAGGALVSTIFFALQGAHFWAFLTAQNRFLLEAVFEGLWQRMYTSDLFFDVGNRVVVLLGSELLRQPVYLIQMLLWGVAAYAVSYFARNRTITVARLLAAAGVGVVVLGVGYYYLPNLAGLASAPAWPGGAGLFWFYMLASAAIVLLPKLLITGRYAPATEPQRLVDLTQPSIGPRLDEWHERHDEQRDGSIGAMEQESGPDPPSKSEDRTGPSIRKIEF